MADEIDALAAWRERQRERDQAAAQARNAAAIELHRLNALPGVDGALDVQGAVHGLGPVQGPERAAAELESLFGKIDEYPSWMNADQFGREATSWTREQGGGDRAEGRSRWLMSPQRRAYMQSGPGRAVDLLKNLRSDPEAALKYWNRSANADTTRDGYTSPNYQRYATFASGLGEAVLNPLSAAGRYLKLQSPTSVALKHEAAGSPSLDAWGAANADQIAARRFRQGEVPVMDIPVRQPGEDASAAAERYANRAAAVGADIAALSGQSPEQLARDKFGSWAPPALGYALDAVYGLADATLPATMLGGLASTPAKWAANNAARALARSASLSRPGARALLARAASVAPEQTAYGRAAKVAGYRGVPAAAYASQLRPPSITSVLPTYGKVMAVQEGTPEAAVEGAIQAALPQPRRTWSQFLFSPADSSGDEEYSRGQEQRRRAAEEAAVRMEALSNQGDQDSVWEAFRRHQVPRRQQEATNARSRNATSGPAGAVVDDDVYGP